MPKSVVFHNGEFHERDTPLVAATDQALVMGQGVFETLIAHEGRLFAFDRHFERLEKSASLLGLEVPARDEVRTSIDEALLKSGFVEEMKCRIRLTVTGGVGDRRFSNDLGKSRLFIEASAAPNFKDFASLITVPFVRNDRGALAGAKTINYGENVVALGLAKKAGADEALFGNTRDVLCEGTWSNVFIFNGGRWITPPLTSGCLPGVTRAIVLEISEKLGIPISETDLEMGSLELIEGSFLTSTLRGLQPVEKIDGRSLPMPMPPGFQKLQNAFCSLTTSDDSARPT